MLYRPDIDGLRALAVLAVILFHIFPEYLHGGFIGVDIFFVISGYLITSGIASALSAGTFTFTGFYARRARRIFPALACVLLFCLVFGWFALLEDEYAALAKHIAAGAGFVSNIALWQEAGYFDAAANAKPLQHLWSLGIEEQFYAVWPLILLACWKKWHRISGGIALIAGASFAANIMLLHAYPSFTFYLPLTRLWELALGGLLCRITIARGNNLWSLAGAALLVAGLLLTDRTTAFPGWLALLPAAGAFCLIAGGAHTWLGRALSLAPLAWMGRISYPLYLWHWPLFSLACIIEAGIPSPGIRLGIVLASFALSVLTYYLVEKPVRRCNARRAGLLSAVALIAMGLAGLLAHLQNGFPARDLGISREQRESFLWEERARRADPRCLAHVGRGMTYCLMDNYDTPPTVALLGDSHANHYFFGAADYYRKRGDNVIQLGDTGGCLALLSGKEMNADCKALEHFLLEYIRAQEHIHTVLIATWGQMKQPQIFTEKLVKTAEFFSPDKKVILLMEVPEIGFDPKSCLPARPYRISPYTQKSPCAAARSDIYAGRSAYEAAAREAAAQLPQLQLFNPADYLCDENWCHAAKDGVFLYRDTNHLSLEGSLFLGGKFDFPPAPPY